MGSTGSREESTYPLWLTYDVKETLIKKEHLCSTEMNLRLTELIEIHCLALSIIKTIMTTTNRQTTVHCSFIYFLNLLKNTWQKDTTIIKIVYFFYPTSLSSAFIQKRLEVLPFIRWKLANQLILRKLVCSISQRELTIKIHLNLRLLS